MSAQLVAVAVARKETVTEEAEAEVPSFLQRSTAVFVRWRLRPRVAAVGALGVAAPHLAKVRGRAVVSAPFFIPS